MKIIQQHHEIVDMTVDAQKKIERIGRVCWKSEDRIQPGSDGPFIERMIDHVTESVLEHSVMTVRFVTDRGVTHELARHRITSPSQESTRYCNYGGSHMQFILPVWMPCILVGTYADEQAVENAVTNDEANLRFLHNCLRTEQDYQFLLDKKWRPEHARQVLNHSLRAEYYLTANMREWRHIFSLRCAPKAHPMMRELMRPLLEEAHRIHEALFHDVWYELIGYKIDEIGQTEDEKSFGTGNPNVEVPKSTDS